MLTFNYGFTHFSNKLVLSKFISVCRMFWDLIWDTSPFYKPKTEEVKRGGKSAIWSNWCFQLSITVASTPPSSMVSWMSNTCLPLLITSLCHAYLKLFLSRQEFASILKCFYAKCIMLGPYLNSNLSLNLNEIWQLIKLTKMAILSRNDTFSSKYQCRGSKLFFILLLHYNPA